MNFKYEKEKLTAGYNFIIGCDEVGRGCLAGPVVAAAVVLDSNLQLKDLREVRDSKLLSAEKREYLAPLIKKHSLWSIAEVSPEVVDEINIHNASLLAMKKAVEGLLSDVGRPVACIKRKSRPRACATMIRYIYLWTANLPSRI